MVALDDAAPPDACVCKLRTDKLVAKATIGAPLQALVDELGAGQGIGRDILLFFSVASVMGNNLFFFT